MDDAPNGKLAMAIVVTGGIGDFMVMARLMRDLVQTSGDVEFDVYCPLPKRADFAFAGVAGFRKSYHDILFEGSKQAYDVAFRINHTIVVYLDHVRWPRVRNAPTLVGMIDHVTRNRPKYNVFIDHYPFTDNFLAQKAAFLGFSRRDFLHHQAGIPYGGDLLTLPQAPDFAAKFRLTPWNYVTVNTGFDEGFIISGRTATKCYPFTGVVIGLLKQQFPNLIFVQIGTARTSKILPECDLNLVGKTTLEEAASLLAESLFHFDSEGGLVHLAACLGTKSVVVFGPTPSNYFAYRDNLSITPLVCGNCWWLEPTWMDHCVKGHPAPACMTEQPPERIADLTIKWIESQTDSQTNLLAAQ